MRPLLRSATNIRNGQITTRRRQCHAECSNQPAEKRTSAETSPLSTRSDDLPPNVDGPMPNVQQLIHLRECPGRLPIIHNCLRHSSTDARHGFKLARAGDIHIHGRPQNRNRIPCAILNWLSQVQRVHVCRRKCAAGGQNCIDESCPVWQGVNPGSPRSRNVPSPLRRFLTLIGT